jgi:hypothetical protein
MIEHMPLAGRFRAGLRDGGVDDGSIVKFTRRGDAHSAFNQSAGRILTRSQTLDASERIGEERPQCDFLINRIRQNFGLMWHETSLHRHQYGEVCLAL